jgi:hypothetical protein
MRILFENMSDDEKLHVAMVNSYDVIVNNMPPEGIIVEQNGIGLFAHDFERPLEKHDVSSIIDYFVEIEEYERCVRLDCILRSLPDE